MPDQGAVLAVDLGQTNLRCALVDRAGRCLERRSVPTPFDDSVGSTLVGLAREVRGRKFVTAGVVGVPGRVDYSRGCLEWGRGLPTSWKEQLRADRLGEELATPVQLANDADLAAVGETYFGSGDPTRSVVYLAVSTGLGAGAVMYGRLLSGRTSILEIGLTLAEPLVTPDGQRRAEVLEDLSSAKSLRRFADSTSPVADPLELIARARSGDARAQSLWDGISRAAGMAAVNLAHLLVPDIIVLGGGISRQGETFRAAVGRAVVDHGPQDLPVPISVRLAALGDDSGLAGTAAWTDAIRLSEGGARREPT